MNIDDRTPEKAGYDFDGWSLVKNGEKEYSAGQEGVTLSVSKTIYARWVRQKTKIIFRDEDTPRIEPGYEVGLPDPVDGAPGATVTIPAPKSPLLRRNYQFNGWTKTKNASAGTTPTHKVNQELEITESIDAPEYVLYPYWRPATSASLSYNRNGATVLSWGLPNAKSYKIDGLTNVFNISDIVPTRKDEYKFAGWSTTADGEVEYQPGAEITLEEGKNITLYAQWVEASYALTYHFNGGDDEMHGELPPIVTGNSTTTGITVAGQGTLAREFHKFIGWKDDAGKDYNEGDEIKLTSDINLYAQWKDLRQTLPPDDPDHPNPGGGEEERTGEAFLRYNSNVTETGIVTNMPADEGGHYNDKINDKATVSGQKPVRPGYTFAGWSEDASESADSTSLLKGGDKLTVIKDKTLYAIWSRNEYRITFNGNGHTAGTVPGDMILDYGQTKALPSVDLRKPGLAFDGWATSADGAIAYAPGADVTVDDDFTNPLTLYAHWKDADSVTLTYDVNAGDDSVTGDLPGTASYKADGIENVFHLSDVVPEREGYSFTGWSTTQNGSVEYAAGAEITLEKHTILYAQWSMGTYTLTYHFNGGSDPMVGELPPSNTGDLTTTGVTAAGQGTMARAFHKFLGWNTAADGSGKAYAVGDPIKFTADINLYAQWKDLRQTLPPDDPDNPDPNPGGGEDRTGEAFLRYNSNVTEAGIVTNMPADEGGHYNDKINDKATVSGQKPVRPGYTFAGWSEDASESADSTSLLKGGDKLTVIKDKTLYAIWSRNEYRVTFNGNGHTAGTVPSDMILDYGQTRALPTVDLKKTGAVFDGWATSADGAVVYAPGADVTVDESFTNPLTLYAHWKTADSVSLTYNTNAGSDTVTGDLPGTTSYQVDGVANIFHLSDTVPVRDGYGFLGWSTTQSGDVEYAAGAEITLTKDTILYAQWDMGSYTLAYHFNGGSDPMVGELPPSKTGDPTTTGITVAGQGTLAREFHKFIGWNTKADGSGKSYNEGDPVKLTANIDLYAQWKDLRQPLEPDDPDYPGPKPDPDDPDPRTGEAFLRYNSNVTEAGTVTNMPADEGGHYNDKINDKATVSSQKPERPGYTFAGWSEDASESADSTSLLTGGEELTVIKDKTLYAIWSKEDYNITFNGNGHDLGTVPDVLKLSYGDTETLPSADLKKVGFVFDGWSKAADGNVDYALGAEITVDGSFTNPLMLYAHWTEADNVSLSYDANAGGDTVTGDLPETATYSVDGITNVFRITNTVPVRPGYGFLGWSTTQNGTVEYASGAEITLTKDTTLYAQWSMGSYTLTYYFNGGSDPMIGELPPSVTGDPTTTGITVAPQGTLAREYYKFIGWKDEAGKSYNVGDPIKLTSNLKLYAQWKDLREKLPPDDPDNPKPDPDPDNPDPDHPNPDDPKPNPGGEDRTGEAFLYYNSNTTSAEAGLIQNMPVPNPEGGHYNDMINNMATVSTQKPIRIGYEFKGWSQKASENPSSTALMQGGAKLEVIKDQTLYAIWEKQDYTLTYDANVPEGDENPISGTFPADGVTGNITTPVNTDHAGGFTRDHYTFKEWNEQADGKGTGYAAGSPITLTKDTTLYAIWEEKEYTVTYSGGTGATGTPPADQTGKYGASFIASQPGDLKNPGKTFTGWKDGNGNSYTPGISYPFEGNVKLTAQWSTDTWTIHYEVPAEVGPSIADVSATLNDTVTLSQGEDLKKSHFVFKGWNTAPNGTSGTAYPKGGSLTIEESTPKTLILYPSWDAATPYKVTYHKNADDAEGTEPPQATCYNDGLEETTEVPADSLTRKGYTFMGWSTNPADSANVEYRAGDTVKPVEAGESIDLYAVWSADSFTLTYDKGNAAAIGTVPETVSASAADKIKAAPQGNLYFARHKFIGWNTEADYSGAKIKAGASISINEDTTLYAEWAPVEAIHVTYYSGCEDPAVDATLPVDTNDYYADGINDQAVISTGKPLRHGYDFDYWSIQPGGGGTPYNGNETVTLTGDLKLYAQWVKGTYTLTYHAGEAPSEVQGSMPKGQSAAGLSEIEVATNKGRFTRPYHTFTGWNTKLDGSGTTYQPGDMLSLGGNTTLYAQWKETEYEVRYDLNSPAISTATGTLPEAVSGTHEEKFTAPEKGDLTCPKYKFVGWNTKADGKGQSFKPGEEYDFGVLDDYAQEYGSEITLYAIWESVPPYEVVYKLKAEDKDATGKLPVDKNKYTVDDGNNLVTVLGPGSLKKKGYEFVCWEDDDGNKYVKDSQFRIKKHTVLYAQFTPGTYQLTYDKNGSDVKGKAPAGILRSSQEDITAAGAGIMTKPGYEFLGWSKNAKAKKPTYKTGQKFRIDEDTTLHAVWRRLLNVSIEENEGLEPSADPIQQVSEGTKLSEIKLPNVKTGYEISYWIVNGEKVTNPEDYTITRDSDVRAVVTKKPEDKKPDDKKPDDKKPDDNKPGGDNPPAGNDNPPSGGGSGSDTTKVAKNTDGKVNLGDSAPVKKNNSVEDGSGTGNGGGKDQDAATISQNGYPSSGAEGNGYGAKGAMLFGLPWAKAMECIIHLIILLCMLLWLALTIYWRVHTRKKCEEDENQSENGMAQGNDRAGEKRRRRPSVLFDSILPMLPIALSIILYQFRRCPLDIIMLMIWLVLTVLNLFLERRSFKKRYQETAGKQETAGRKESLERSNSPIS